MSRSGFVLKIMLIFGKLLCIVYLDMFPLLYRLTNYTIIILWLHYFIALTFRFHFYLYLRAADSCFTIICEASKSERCCKRRNLLLI